MGAMAKITPAQIAIIGTVLTIISAVVIYFTLMKPQLELKDQHQQKFDAAELIANEDPAAKTDRKKALAEVARAEADWRRYDRALMPNIDISNLLTGQQQLWREQIKVLGPKVDKFLMADKSVRVVQKQIALPAPEADPNKIVRQVFTFELGSVAVQGTFPAILKHAGRWNQFDRLVLMDGLTLSGNSPRLTGQYTLTCFIFTHGAEKPGPAIPWAGTAPGGGFGGGGGGGYGAGYGAGYGPSPGGDMGAPAPPEMGGGDMGAPPPDM